LDLSLHDASGIELIKDLKKVCPGLLVLVLSMRDESLYAVRSLRAGASGYIMKGETTEEVLEAIRRVLAGQLYLSHAMEAAITTQFVEGKMLATSSPAERLSDREFEIFELLGQGRGTRQIAEVLRLSVKTVQAGCGRLKKKLSLSSPTELVREAVRWHEIASRG
jgi:DNA-binding NarL/FixJ family response regulator